MPIDDRTINLNLALPHEDNALSDDVNRLRSALNALDTAVFARPAVAAVEAIVDAAIAELVAGSSAALDTLQELAAAIGNDANYAATVTAAINSRLPNVPATASVLGGVKIGSGITVGPDGTISVSLGGGGTGLPAFTETIMIPATNGQVTFSPAGGYEPGQIEVYLNGVLLYGNGDDYTAANGTTFTLATGINTTDTILLRKWAYLAAANAVNKLGDTMLGNLTVPNLVATEGIQLTRGAGQDAFASVEQTEASATSTARPNVLWRKNGATRLQVSADGTTLNQGAAYYDAIGSAAKHHFLTNGILQFVVELVTGAVNQLRAAGSTTGTPVVLSAQGSDANIDVSITPKGTGAVRIRDVPVLVTANATATAFRTHVFTATADLSLPAAAAAGDWIKYKNRSGVLTPRILRNGHNIEGVADDIVLNSTAASGTLVYIDPTRGWINL